MKLAAKWILPVASEPIANGVVVFENDRITALGPRDLFNGDDIEDLGDDMVIMPGLVNAHTHLELSHLQGLVTEPRDLPEWLLRILALQQNLTQAELEQLTGRAVQLGAKQSLEQGVSTIGDISRFCHLSRPLLKEGPLRVVSFGEVLGIGTRRHLIDDRLRVAADPRYESERLKTALSPHAPYSVEADGLKRIVEHARLKDMQTCIHLAETVEEIQFLQTGQGRIREMLDMIGVWDEHIVIPRRTPIRWTSELGVLGPECVVAHGNYLDDDEVDLLCASGASVAYCPRSHAYFGHHPHPLLKLIGGGVNVCLGTDSLGSAPSLSILEEMKYVKNKFPELSAEMVVMLGTINGARALGMAGQIGSLEEGKKADLAVFQLAGDDHDNPAEALLEHSDKPQRLYINGQRVR